MRPSLTFALVAAFAASTLLVGCAGSSGNASPPPSSTRFVVDPLLPGHGFLQLGPNRYVFEGVICASGPVASDPKYTVRDFGVYANFTLDGSLVAVSMTRYENHSPGSVPTITETAQVQMQGKGEVKGLKAQRANIIGQSHWGDVYDPTASGPLISKKGDRYSAKGLFGPPDDGGSTPSGSTTTSTTLAGSSETTAGDLEARCPAKSATSATTAPPTTTGLATSSTTTTGLATSSTTGTSPSTGAPASGTTSR